MIKQRFKLNVALKQFKKGSNVSLDVGSDNLPISVFWRNRLLDKCIESVETLTTKEKSVSKKYLKNKEGIKDDSF